MSSAVASSSDLQEQQEELRSAQAQRREHLVVLNAQLAYAEHDLAELEARAELDGVDNSAAIAEKEATIAQIGRGIRAKTIVLARQDADALVLQERHAAAQLRELSATEQQILDETPAGDARVGAAAFALLQAISAREALWRRLQYTQLLMNQVHERSGHGNGRIVRTYEPPRSDMDTIVGAALGWAQSAGHQVDMDTWTFVESDEKGAQQ